MNPEGNFTPFNDQLSEELLNYDKDYLPPSEIRNLENNPDKVVRITTMQTTDFTDPEHLNDVDPRSGTEKAIEYAVKAKAYFGEAAKYISIPGYKFIVGEHPRQRDYPTVYNVTDKVTGSDLDSAIYQKNSRLKNQELQKFYEALFQYYKDKIDTEGVYLTDLNRHEQYMYGHTSEDPTDRIYLVDLDLLWAKYDKTSIESRNTMWNRLEHTRIMIGEATRSRGEEFNSVLEKVTQLQRVVFPERYRDK